MSEFKARAARGAALLDELRPGWYRDVDANTFSIVSTTQCIVGQLFGDWTYGTQELNIEGNRDACEHFGFELTEDEYGLEAPRDILESRWLLEIANRFHASH